MEKLEFAIEKAAEFVWGPALLILLLGAGLFFTVGSGFFPIRKAGFVLRSTLVTLFKKKDKSAFEAMATALGATVGTGNIVGVASAIAIGGPGAVFWMWVGALLGMMLKFAEAALAVKFREQGDGALVYIEKAFGSKKFAALWAVFCILASFGSGNMVQTNAAAVICREVFGLPEFIAGSAIAFLTAAVLFKGAKAVTKTSSFLVPLMAAFYVIGCGELLFICRENIAGAFSSIFSDAFSPVSAGGGISGLLISNTLRTGIAKGTFTHEAGMGSASLAHAESNERDPAVQGCWGIIEVFIDTIFVCTLTALVILSSGITVISENSTTEVFGAYLGDFGKGFLAVSMFLFALAAVIGWAFYGEKALGFIFKSRKVTIAYRALFCLCSIAGSVVSVPVVWNLSDIFNGLMVFPNLAALVALSGVVFSFTAGTPEKRKKQQ